MIRGKGGWQLRHDLLTQVTIQSATFIWTTPTSPQVLDCFLEKQYLYVCICVGGCVWAKVKKKRREWSYLHHIHPLQSPPASQYLAEILDRSDWPIQISLKRPLKEKCRNWLEIELRLHVCHPCVLIKAAQGRKSVSLTIVKFKRRKSNSVSPAGCLTPVLRGFLTVLNKNKRLCFHFE